MRRITDGSRHEVELHDPMPSKLVTRPRPGPSPFSLSTPLSKEASTPKNRNPRVFISTRYPAVGLSNRSTVGNAFDQVNDIYAGPTEGIGIGHAHVDAWRRCLAPMPVAESPTSISAAHRTMTASYCCP